MLNVSKCLGTALAVLASLVCASVDSSVAHAAPEIDVFGRPIAPQSQPASQPLPEPAQPKLQPASEAKPAGAAGAHAERPGPIGSASTADAGAARDANADAHASTPTTPESMRASHAFHWPEPIRVVLAAGLVWQGELNADIEDAASALRESPTHGMWLTLILTSFAYGVLHAVGPGHGKLVVGTWLGSRRSRVTHALLLSGWTAFVQALSAIVLVFGVAWVSTGGLSMVLPQAASLEFVSYALLCAAGAWALWNAVTRADCCFDPAAIRLPRGDTQASTRESGSGFGDLAGVDDVDDEGRGAYLGARITPIKRSASFTARSSAARAGGASRMSIAFARLRMSTLGQLIATGIATGVRPCAGAIFVLVASVAAHAPWIGVASTLAMGLGVAITVSIVALVGVGANRLISRSQRHRYRLQAAQRVFAIGGAVLIVVFAGTQLALLLFGVTQASLM